ncbi:hypothetical protein CkaCkLH20_04546 [Colletotrichum karsti]|uniref:Major facilitator superfamily (MFS) profile domain-containing protein n=1 Tax=Colletotrichum karsti TaxID=1095194 RepID=A0A9P6I8N2_9PEZI|nr:uncharacterized protein CkaCkLH20_04546 [Colletotrichum karsti]KAF9877970.1 hypothetical protein CkaCkLH20_04546 [Colletotrichum karsti]
MNAEVSNYERSRSAQSHDDPPDGGYSAWMSVLAAFLSIMNTWGLVISVGVFQTYQVNNLHRSPADIAWIGSLAVFFLFFGGLVTGRLSDSGYFHHVTIIGVILITLGTFMTSICEKYWQLVIAQGLCVGLGNGCLQTPMMAVVSTYFRKKLPLAMGIAACGSVAEGLVYPSMARTLLPTVGFGWTMRAIGFVQTGTLAIAVASAFFGVFFGFFFLTSYARDIQGMTYTESLDLLLVLNGIGFVGRLLPSLIARYLGTLNTFILLLFGSQLTMFTWMAVDSTAGIYGWTTFYSLVIGGVQSLLLPAAIASLETDMRRLGSRMGIVFSAIGVGALVGSPIGGAPISKMNGSYVGAQAFAGGSLAVGGIFVAAAREARRREDRQHIWVKM